MNRQDHFNKAGIEIKHEDQPQQAPLPYLEPGKCYIFINDKPYRCAFTMLQMEIMKREMDKYNTDTERAACLPYSSLIVGARQDKKELDITFEDVFQWFDESFTENSGEYQAFDAAYKASTYYKRFVEPAIEEEEKKRALSQTRQELSQQEY